MSQVPLVPTFVEGINDDLFVATDLLAPVEFEIAGVKQFTSALKPGRINLMGLALAQPLVNAGIVSYTDCIDARVYVKSVVLRTPDNFIVVDTMKLPRTQFVKSVEGHYGDLTVALNVSTLTPGSDTITLKLNGVLNVQTGNLDMVVVSDNEDYAIIGYTLDANFHNPNSRAAVDAVNNVL